MSIDKKKIKQKLEEEKKSLLEKMDDMGKMDSKTHEWEATSEEMTSPEPDPNEMADRFEEFESKSATLDVLEGRLNSVEEALNNLNENSFGKCKTCKKEIENDRLEANSAATTCKEHLEN